MQPIKICKLTPEAQIPVKATPGAIGYDVIVPRDIMIKPGRQVIPLEWSIALPDLIEAKIEARSGNSAKGMAGLYMNGTSEGRFDADVIPGKIDPDYRGGCGVIICSRDPRCFIIPAGSRIAQLTLYQVGEASFIEVLSLDETERGDGGFGHSGNRELK